MSYKRRLVIIGGVAAGASAAARARRLSEETEILILERGPHISFANCGLPYFIGGEIKEHDKLILQTPESLGKRFNLDIRVLSEVELIDREAKEIEVKDLRTGKRYRERYDSLILSVGASPLKPPILGIDQPGHFTLRNIPDMDAILGWIEEKGASNAVVVGGGYIGLEVAEQLHLKGLNVTIAEALPQVMAPLDPEMAAYLHKELKDKNIDLHLNDGVSHFEVPNSNSSAKASIVVLKSGKRLPADLVILGLGVRPEIRLAKDAGLDIGQFGIRVDEHMRTNDPNIWAVGDVVEVKNAVTGMWSVIPLAGPANRQGRIAADVIFGRTSTYKGTWGTALLKLFNLTAGSTGANEKSLKLANIPYLVVHLHPNSHAGYYPGASTIALKVLLSPESGKLLGAQAVGHDGVDKRIDVLATALQAGMSIYDLAELELGYAPPYGSAKDPINLAGMIAENMLHGDLETIQWHEVQGKQIEGALILDVRSEKERQAGAIPDSVHIPLPDLRNRLDELPKDKELIVYCQSGQRSYYATRLLLQKGFKAYNLSGAYQTWKTAAEALI
jgi:NADPH-dependent 2,4-dienoyl-CoA reductase/sulfur reductase-like enzyme/rhodanese-related sulfurtransferase